MNGLLPMHPVIRLLFAFSLLLAGPALADPAPGSWDQALRQARGQTVYFNAWGGSGQINAYVAWAAERVKAHPGRFTYPAPPDFTGTSFLKQALYELIDDAARLGRPVDDGGFASASAPLWRFLDELHPLLWRHGHQFPRDSEALRQVLDD